MRKPDLTILLAASSAALMTFAVYLSDLHNTFLEWDDGTYVTENPHIRSIDMAFFKWALTGFHASNWHPLTWLSHSLDYRIWGLNPFGHHLTSNIIHAVNTFVVVLLTKKLLESADRSGQKGAAEKGPVSTRGPRKVLIAATVTGLLFGLHPLHVESVAWIAERKDLLCAFFYMLSMLSYAEYAVGVIREPGRGSSVLRFFDRHYLLSFTFLVLALLSKPMAVTLPFVLLILDWYPFRRIRSLRTLLNVSIEKIPFIAMAFFSSVITLLAQRDAMSPITIVPLSTRLLVAARAVDYYLLKMLLPRGLLPFYPYPHKISLVSTEGLASLALVALILFICLYAAKRNKVWTAALAYYLLTLVPVLGIIQVGKQAMADRYTYLPGLGPFLLMGLGTAWAWSKLDSLKTHDRGIRIIAAVMALSVTSLMSFATLKQIKIWKNSIDLWTHVIDKEPASVAFVYNNRAAAFHRTGRLDEAIADYSKAIELDPGEFSYYNNRGTAYSARLQYDLALADYEKAYGLYKKGGSASYNIACLYSLQKDVEEACVWLERSMTDGYDDWEHIREDKDLDNIRQKDCYKKIMGRSGR